MFREKPQSKGMVKGQFKLGFGLPKKTTKKQQQMVVFMKLYIKVIEI